jgi:phage gp16-like protein
MMIQQPRKNAHTVPIHVARRALGMDDATYRALLQRVAGVSSSRELSPGAAARVVDEFRRLGWVPTPQRAPKARAGRPHNFDELPLRITKIEAQLADMGLPWSYAEGISKQMFRVKRIAWLRHPRQLDALIAALDKEQEKRALLAEVEGLCRAQGFESPDELQAVFPLPAGWQRKVGILRKVIEALSNTEAGQ